MSCDIIKDHIVISRSPIADFKSVKNETEIEGFRQCHIRDGAALVRYFAWLEEKLEAGVQLSESQAADQLEKFRSELDLFRGLSFTTISSTGPNVAIIHYSPDPNDCAIVRKDQVKYIVCFEAFAQVLRIDLPLRLRRAISRRHDRRHTYSALRHSYGRRTACVHTCLTRPYCD